MAVFSNTPGDRFRKAAAQTKEEQSPGSKVLRTERLRSGQVADLGRASTSRIYTRDYSKVGKSKDDQDTVGPFLGNPLIW